MKHVQKQSHNKLVFDDLIDALKEAMKTFPDQRTGNNLVYSIEDAAMGAFAVFFTQSPSFLAYQKSMEQSNGKSNAQTVFGMHKIPTDNHIRSLLDKVSPSYVFPVFEQIADALNDAGHIDSMRALDGQLLIALDGTVYHHSHRIHCKNCTVTQHKNGEISYGHTVITPVIVSPGHGHVIPLEPEFIVPQDGHAKQDCETAAAKRWLATFGVRYRDRSATVLGDDLYSRQPVCEQILAAGLNFILVCKAGSHTTLYEWLAGLEHSGGVQTLCSTRRHGKKKFTDTYRYASGLPLRDGHDALSVNWCELVTTDAEGKIIYKNAFISSHPIDHNNVAEIVRCGRARWKIENENNNTLKTKGYHLEHNFGHGAEHLSSLLATFNLLAFLLHTVQEISCEKYQLLRACLPTRETFFNDIRALTRYICFDNFEAMIDFMLRGLEIDFPNTS